MGNTAFTQNPTQVYVGTMTISASGSKAITGVGFKPKIVEFYNALDVSSAAASMMVGMATSSSNEFAIWQTGRTSTTDGDDSNIETDKCIAIYGMNTSGVAQAQVLADLTSMDSDGFTINVSTYTTSRVVAFKCSA